MPVLLLQPPGACRAFTRSGSVYPPLGLCQLAAVEPRAVVLDADGNGWDDATTEAAIRKAAPRVLGLTATTYTLALVERWAAVARAAGSTVVVGGPHATLDPGDVFDRCPNVDVVVQGEGEGTIGALVDGLLRGDDVSGLPGVGTRSRRATRPGLRVEDFSSLPFPNFQGLPVENYACPDARRRPMVTFMTARGCPHRCGFCSSPLLLGRKVRGWAVPAVLDELERLVVRIGVREVSFVDDVFTIQKPRTLALCQGMVDRGLDLSWFCNARADQVTPAVAAAMAAAGCHQVYLGFESGSQAILDRIHKDATVARLEEGARLLAEAGIARSVGFVLGLPGETEATVAASIELAWRVKPERLQFTRWTSLPGTPLSADGVASGTGFHGAGADATGRWVEQAYAACAGQYWGARSW